MTLTQFVRALEQRKEAMLHRAALIPQSTEEQQQWIKNCIEEDFRVIFSNLESMEREVFHRKA